MMYGSNLLIVRPFYGEYLPLLFDLGFAVLNVGVLFYVVSEISLYGAAVVKSRILVQKYIKRKLRKRTNEPVFSINSP